ncbi:CPBP family intramembrane glutamic endopeptidase [Marinomonas foliarum]|uniref:CPBP family intramembrane metalloprotease n=1 Tax=Marinomonas foliarum TaxID=491950 RepID=A0ABX7ITV7_9GAMM|nr:CPBP family intramembrane glutamic endopeptidase [Marinomonas foliarum]QRV25519.1 CPBP family intramembrane metalloprotease [Marinomonas foliarum]
MAFYLLGLSILLVFAPLKFSIIKIPLWGMSSLIAVLVGFIEGVLSIQGVAVIFVYSGLLFASLLLRVVWLRRVVVGIFGVFSLALATHLLPGFNNNAVVIDESVSRDGIPFSLYANFDKGLAGLFLIVYFFRGQANVSYFKALQKSKGALVIFFATPCLALGLATLLGLIHIDVKLPSFWLAFLVINLLFTCVAEEAFFRGFMQRELSNWLKGKSYMFVIPIVPALLFGIAHVGGGIEYVIVAGVAGLGYGYLYYLTNRIELSILCHFIVNALHLFLFTYPMLA